MHLVRPPLLFYPPLLGATAQRSFATAGSTARKGWTLRRKAGLLAGSIVSLYGLKSYIVHSRQERIRALHRSSCEAEWPQRRSNLDAMRKPGKVFDVLVIGGGATGCGAALDAATRGLDVALVEKEDFGSGTSSRSTKLIWAGSRYLVQGLVKLFGPAFVMDPLGTWRDFKETFKMVMGCHRERKFLLELNPHLTNWIPIAVPVDSWIIWPPPFGYWPAALGPLTMMFPLFFKFYDALGGFCSPSSHVLSASGAEQDFPQLAAREGNTMKYVSVFYEGQHNDSRTNLAIAFTAAMRGATISNYTEVISIIFGDDGKAAGARVRDTQTGDEFDVRAKTLLYCGGPFTDDLRRLSEGKDCKPCVKGCAGTHLVIPKFFTPREIGLVDMQTSDGRFLFFLPWQDHCLVGTTDRPVDKPTLHQKPPEEEIEWLLHECNKYLGAGMRVERGHVLSAWCGTRPLAHDPNKEGQKGSRDHVVSFHEPTGITFISGGKWTTYREMAEDAIDQVLARGPKDLQEKAGPCRTEETPLIGCGPTPLTPKGFHWNLKYEIAQRYLFKFDVADHMVNTYGTRVDEVMSYAKEIEPSKTGLATHYGRFYPGYPYIEPELRYAIHREYAVTPLDFLSRRTRLTYLNVNAAKIVLPRVCEIMQEELGWSDSRREKELAASLILLDQDFVGPPSDISSSSALSSTDAVGLSRKLSFRPQNLQASGDRASGIAFG